MAYTAWSVVYGEQPTAAKWNQLGQNDAGFRDGTNFDADIIKSKHIDWAATGGGDNGGIWYEELGRTVLASAADSIDVSFTAKQFLRIYIQTKATGGTVENAFRVNNDSANSYAVRLSTNGGADSTSVNQNRAQLAGEFAYSFAGAILDVVNLASAEKNITGQRFGNFSGTPASAGSAPDRAELLIKWANTSQQINRITAINTTGTGDFAAGSQVVVLGHD